MSYCLAQLIKSDYIQCPRCKKIHGVRIGNQPQSGHMKASRLASSLPGYPTCGTIQIHYDFHGGVQVFNSDETKTLCDRLTVDLCRDQNILHLVSLIQPTAFHVDVTCLTTKMAIR